MGLQGLGRTPSHLPGRTIRAEALARSGHLGRKAKQQRSAGSGNGEAEGCLACWQGLEGRGWRAWPRAAEEGARIPLGVRLEDSWQMVVLSRTSAKRGNNGVL